MAHHLNTNKQFMVGNGILAFAVIFVVVIFIYMSLRLQRENQAERHYIETYTISLVKGFAGDSISLFVNDSLIANQVMQEEAFTVEVGRFAEQSALMIVDNKTFSISARREELISLKKKRTESNSLLNKSLLNIRSSLSQASYISVRYFFNSLRKARALPSVNRFSKSQKRSL